MDPAPPSVSTGTFIERVIEDAKDLRKAGIAEITITWNGKAFSTVVTPDTILSYTTRIRGKLRAVGAAYLVWRDGNKCSIRSPFCSMGQQPFADPVHASFDHIDGINTHNQAHNLRLSCISCDSHIQNEQRLQWKRDVTAAPDRTGERESLATALPIEIDLNVRIFPRYERWLDENLKAAHGIPLDEAIFTATREIRRELGHGAHQTIRGYLQVLTTGPDAPYYVDGETKRVLRRGTKP